MSSRIRMGWTREKGSSGLWTAIYAPRDMHMVCCAEPGSGKTRSVAIPNLIEYAGSAVVGDFKDAELAKATGLWRSAVLGQQVYFLDPFGLVDPSVYGTGTENDGIRRPQRLRINPVDFVRTARAPLISSMAVMTSIVPPGGIKETHWADGAKGMGAAPMLYVALDPQMEELGLPRNMETWWHILGNPKVGQEAWEWMRRSRHPFVADQAAVFHKPAKGNLEIASIKNHLRVNCAPMFGERAILETLTATTVDFTKINTEPITVYIILPGDMLDTLFRYARLVFSLILGYIERAGLVAHDNAQPPTLFLIDEFASLGKFDLAVRAMARMRGLGGRFLLFVQSLSQLVNLYGEAGLKEILGNAGVLDYFGGTNDVYTAEYLSKLCGTGTVVTETINHSTRPGDQGGRSYGQSPRSVYTPDEVMRLQLPSQIIKIKDRQAMEETLIHPSLRSYPEYWVFTKTLNNGGSLAKAVENAASMYRQAREGRFDHVGRV